MQLRVDLSLFDQTIDLTVIQQVFTAKLDGFVVLIDFITLC